MITRAKVLLGTLVTIQVDAAMPGVVVNDAIDKAFEVVAHIGAVMSAHSGDADPARMSRAVRGQVLQLDTHTIEVLRAARHWWRLSAGAFHPVKAARTLACQGLRPGLSPLASGTLDDVDIVSPTQVIMKAPVCLDLGGIAKGYAVDQAMAVLQAMGVRHALVNAGGDLRVLGEKPFGVEVRHAGRGLRERQLPVLRQLRGKALATSVAAHQDTAFVPSLPGRRGAWQSATVMASDCMTADVLTKWALQSSLLCPQLKAVMRGHQARMWRS